jgi:hypothetical protein
MLSHGRKFGPREYEYLREHEVLRPRDLVTISEALAGYLQRGHETQTHWHRCLGLALFERFGLGELPRNRAFAEATSGPELMRALGAIEAAWGDPVANAWRYRHQLLALPAPSSGHLEGHPFWLSFPSRIPEPLRPLAESVSDDLLAHALAAEKLVWELDRVLVALWGCPVERLDSTVTVAELVATGLRVPTPPPPEPWE